MSYSILVRFTTNLSAGKMNKQIMLDHDILHSACHGCEMNLTIQDSVRTHAILTFLRSFPDVEKIQVRDDDGWECEEVDLLSEKEIAELSVSLSCAPTGHIGDEPTDTAPAHKVPADKAPTHTSPAHNVPHLILASQSPRRQELLGLVGIPFEAKAADIDEEAEACAVKEQCSKEPFSIIAAMIVMHLARAKARKLLDTNPDDVVIGSDTIVTIDASILGKPTSPDDAFEMLQRLSGREHHVFTGVSIISRSKEVTFFTVTRVGFYPWSIGEIELARRYIAEGSPLDKAGAYGIQDMGALFIRGIKGDFYTVMGLPVSEVYHRLKDFGIS